MNDIQQTASEAWRAAAPNGPIGQSPERIAELRADEGPGEPDDLQLAVWGVRRKPRAEVSPYTGHRYDCAAYETCDESDCNCDAFSAEEVS
jgi:hypothetical protein